MRGDYTSSPNFLSLGGGYNTEMQRKSNALGSFGAFLSVMLLIFAPVLTSGYMELGHAIQAQRTGDHDAASRAYELAARRLPWRNDLWEQAGTEAFDAGLPAQAIDFLGRRTSLSSRGLVTLGQAYQQVGKPQLAIESYRAALEEGASAEIYSGLASAYHETGSLAAERSALQNQLLLDPGDAAAQYRLGLLMSLSDINTATTHLQMAAQLDPEYEPVWETLRSALALADLSPSESDRLVTLGRAMALVGEWDLAHQAFMQAVESGEQNAPAWAWLGEAKQHLRQDGSAELDKALALDPQSVVVRGLRGLYWKRQGKEPLALQEYQAAASSEPQNPAWSASLGETYSSMGDLVSALASFEKATQQAPGDPLYWRLLATFCLENNIQVDEIGLPAARKALDLAPDDPLALDILGWAELAAGQPWAAQETLLKAVRTAPEYALAHFHLSQAYLQTGDRTAAYNQLKLVVQLNPGGPLGAQAAQLLEQQFP
jgi:tetratricopeptide (TPR) repeat protein